jgi:hypothetical protein
LSVEPGPILRHVVHERQWRESLFLLLYCKVLEISIASAGAGPAIAAGTRCRREAAWVVNY